MGNKSSDISKQERQQKVFQQLRLLSLETAMSATEICEALKLHGHSFSRKTITRDLDEIKGVVSIEGGTQRYYLSPDYRSDYQINLNEDELQIIVIALSQLKQSSPDYFKNLCKQAEETLKEKLPKTLAKEFSKLQGLSISNPSLSGRDKSEDAKSMEQVLKALRGELIIECENHSPYAPLKNKDKRTFGPLMLNMVGGIPYILMHDPNDKKNPVKNLRLSRLHKVEILSSKVDRTMLKHAKTMDLSFSGYGGTTEEIIDFEILCHKNMGQYFMEREINHTQKIKAEGESFRLSFRSHASLDLIRLLAGFGDEIQTVKPVAQFKRLQEIWKKSPKT